MKESHSECGEIKQVSLFSDHNNSCPCKCQAKCPCDNACSQCRLPNFYAQFGVFSNPESGSYLSFYEIFRRGDGISLENSDTIVLTPGYLYLIDYIFLATPEPGNFMQIIPAINGIFRLQYSFFAPAGSERDTSASGGFTTNEAIVDEARIQMQITYPESVNNIDISGSVSVTPLMRIIE